jgi:hypothetical protein
MSEWYYMSGGEQHGPVTGAQLKSLAASGGLLPEDLVWNQSMTEWVAARRVKGLPFAGMAQAAKSPAPVRAAAAAARAAPVAAPVQAAPSPEPEEPAQPFMSDQSAATAAREAEEAQAASDNHQSHAQSEKPAEAAPPADSFRAHPRSQAAMLGVPMNAVELFGRTRTPVRLIAFLTFLLMLVALAATALAALEQFDHARKFLTVPLQAKGDKFLRPAILPLTDMHFLIVAGIYAFVTLILMFLLGRYSSRIGKLRATSAAEELENALRAQTTLWKFMMLAVIVTVALFVLAYLRFQLHMV